MAFRNMHLIVNPLSGQNKPPVEQMCSLLDGCQTTWYVHETSPEKRAEQLAQRAVDKGADAVAVYGGDGTVVGAAAGVVDSSVPLVVLPGGTANVFAEELRIPNDWQAALQLATVDQPIIRAVDVGVVREGDHEERYFLLQLSIGLGADLSGGAIGADKKRLGRFAYLLSAWRAYRRQSVVRYAITVDEQIHESNAVHVSVCNSARTGVPGLLMHPHITIDDGMLDVLIMEEIDLRSIFALFSRTLLSYITQRIPEFDAESGVARVTGRELSIDTEAPHPMSIDGDAIEAHFPAVITIKPGALRVVVPPEAPLFPFDINPLSD